MRIQFDKFDHSDFPVGAEAELGHGGGEEVRVWQHVAWTKSGQ